MPAFVISFEISDHGDALARRTSLIDKIAIEAISGLSAVLTDAVAEMEKDRHEEIDLRKKQHDAFVEEVRLLRHQMRELLSRQP